MESEIMVRFLETPATRNRTRDHLIAAAIYSQMLCQLSYSRIVFHDWIKNHFVYPLYGPRISHRLPNLLLVLHTPVTFKDLY